MTDGASAFESGYDPGHPVDQAIMATRRAVIPLPGLDATVTGNSS
jgi:hypothetical protein